MSQIITFIYYDGRKFEGSEGMVFEGKKRAMHLKPNISIDNLKQSIHTRLKLGRNQVISRVTGRLLISQNPNKFTGVEVFDDEDVACIINAFKQQMLMTMLELYVDIDQTGSSSVPMNTQHAMTNGSVRCIEETNNAGAKYDENEREEGQLPYGNLSDTEVEGDFDTNFEPSITPVSPASLVPPAVPHDVDYESHNSSTVPFWNSIPHYTYIDWEYPDQEDDFYGLDVSDSWQSGEELYVGMRFDIKHAVQLALKHYTMKIQQSYRVIESNPTIFTVRCPNSTEDCPCPWRMRAMLSKKSNKWTITKWGGQHTCVNQILSKDHSKCDSDFICTCILGMIKDQPSAPISLIQKRIKEMFGYTVSYGKAWKAKQKALTKISGD